MANNDYKEHVSTAQRNKIDYLDINYDTETITTNIQGNATSADKLNTNAGSAVIPIYFKNGIPVASNGTVGSAIKPIWLNKGTITVSDGTIGSGVKPIYLTNGTITESTETVGSAIKPVWLNSGTITASTETVGSAIKPIWLNKGTITVSNGAVGSSIKPIYLTGGTITESSETVGSGIKPIWLNAGTITASNSTIGSGVKPIYLNAGEVTVSNSNVGSGVKPVYLKAGEITVSNSTVGSGVKPVYLNAGEITVSSSTVGSAIKPVWLSGGTITVSDGNVGSAIKPIYLTGGTITESKTTVGTTKQAVYLKAGEITVLSDTVGSTTKPVYMKAGVITELSTTVGSGVKPIYSNAGELTVSTSTVGSTSKPVYLNSGEITALSATVGGTVKPVWMNGGTITAFSTTVGTTSKPVYMNAGEITALSATVGSLNNPVYMNAGTISECTGIRTPYNVTYVNTGTIKLSTYTTCGIYGFGTSCTYDSTDPLPSTAGTNGWLIVLPISGTSNTTVKQIWMRQGTATSNSFNTFERLVTATTVGTWRRFATMGDSLTNNKLAYYNGTHITTYTTDVGSATKPVYISAGIPTICNDTIANNITGNAATATILQTARTINGTSFNGSANITTANWGTARNISISDSSGANTGTAVSVNGSDAVTLKLPATIKATLTGNASTATTLQTARNINGTSFDGSKNITTEQWGTARNIYIADSDSTNTGAAVSVNGSGNATLKLPATIKASLTGNATTATTLQTARTINGTSFNGSDNITTANWGTARDISISDSDGTNTGTAVSVNGSAAYKLKLPATIKATLSGNATSASTLATTATNPESATTYYVPFHSSTSGNITMRNNNGIRYYALQGTEDTLGYGTLYLGNNAPEGTDGNKYGVARLYGTNTAYVQISGQKHDGTSNYTAYLPKKTGYIAVGGSSTSGAVGSSTKPVYMAETGIVTACGTSLDVSISGTAAKATADASNQTITSTYIKSISINDSNKMTITKGSGTESTIQIKPIAVWG